MPFTVEERVAMCLIYAQAGTSAGEARNEFHQRFPESVIPSRETIRKVFNRFRETGSVLNRKRKRQRPGTGDETAAGVLANVAIEPHASTRQIANAHGISQSSVLRILRAHRFHPYKMQIRHALLDTDLPRRVTFAQWVIHKVDEDATWISNVLVSDEALFYLNGRVNTQNYRYWADVNPHWMVGTKALNSPRVMVWCGIYNNNVVGPFFFDGTVTGETYLAMLEGFLTEWLDNLPLARRQRLWFQQDGASAHFARPVRDWLDNEFPGQWIGRGGPVAWPARSPDLTPMDFYLWGFIKSLVFIDQPDSIDTLKERITAAVHAVLPQTLCLVRQEWSARMEHVVAVQGAHVEHLR